MAKSKKRSGGSPTGTRTRGPQGTPPAAPRPAPATPGGPNRLARKEEARRQREALQRRAGRRRLYRIAAIVTAVAVVAALVILAVVVIVPPSPAKSAGCSGVNTVPPYPGGQDRAHIGAASGPAKAPPLNTYPSTPPASGPHNSTPLDAGVYESPPDITMAIHSLEHGAVEIWYAPSAANSAELAKIKQFYGLPANQDHVIVAPYSYPGPGGRLPGGKQVALVSWHVIQSCEKPSPTVVKDFVKKYRAPSGFNPANRGSYEGTAPEAGSAI